MLRSISCSKLESDWIIYRNRFKLTKLLSSDIDIPKWGFHTWSNRHSCHLRSTTIYFPASVPRRREKEGKNYRSIPAWSKSFREIKATPFSAVRALRLAERFCSRLWRSCEFFSPLSRLVPTNSSACRNRSMFIYDGGRTMFSGCMYRTFTRDAITRSHDARASRHHRALNASPTIYARLHTVISVTIYVAFVYFERGFLARRCLKGYSTLSANLRFRFEISRQHSLASYLIRSMN